MNENEPAEKFSRELDAAFSGGGRRAGPASDPGAAETARKLARADFSGDSAIKGTLRAELLARAGEAAGFGVFAPRFRGSSWLQAAAAAACLLLVLLPVMRRGGEKQLPAPPAQPIAAPLRINPAALPGGVKAPRVPEAGPAAAARAVPAPVSSPSAQPERAAGPGVFRSIPMASLSGGRAREFPIESRTAASLFGQAKVRKVALPKGSGVVWETEHAVFTLERRETSPEELFQRKAI